MSYILELHAHTKDISLCSTCSAENLARLYTEAGYNGVVLTNHFDPYTVPHLPAPTWEEKVMTYYAAYEKLRDAAAGRLDVIFGTELRMKDYYNDYLLIGVNVEFLLNRPDIFDFGIKKLSNECRENGIMLFQAHPFRNGMSVVDPKYLDGLEVYNGHAGHDSRNSIALAWAERFGLLQSSGSDFHCEDFAIDGGIETDERIVSQEQLREVIRSGNYKLVKRLDLR